MRRFILSTRIIILTILIGTFGGLALVLVITIAGSVSTNIKPYYSTPIYLIILLMPALSGALIGYTWDCSRSRRLSRYTESRRAAGFEKLPVSVTDFIAEVIKKMRYRRRVRRDVELELICYFNDAINDFKTDEEKDARAQTLIEQFGDPKHLAQLIRRAKKRCRPIWKKTLIRTAQATAALLLFFCFYTWWFVTGKPNITIDYVARLNQMVQPQVPDIQNAWPYYQKAIDQLAEPNEILKEIFASIRRGKEHVSFASLSVLEQQAIGDWITRNEDAWAEYFTAGKQGHFWYDYKTSNPDRVDQELMSVLMLPLGEMKALSKLGIWKAQQFLQQGDIQEALDHCLAVIRTGRHLRGTPTLIEQFVGLAIRHMGHKEILRIFGDTKLSVPQLIHVQKQLTALYSDGYPEINFEFERLIHHDVVQWYFTDSGPGGGHLLPKAQNLFGWHPYLMIGREDPTFVPVSMIHAGRHDTLNLFNTAWDMAEKQARLTPWQMHTSTDPTAIDYIYSLPKYRYFIVQTMFPAAHRASEMVQRGKALHEATLTILALHRWKLQKGSFPDSLEELIDPGLLKSLPLDPYRDGPLTYKKQGDDFILYSYAGDFDDDQGQQNPDQRAWNEEDGDRRFWPLETPTPTSTDL